MDTNKKIALLIITTAILVGVNFYYYVAFPLYLHYMADEQFYYPPNETIYCSNAEDCRHEQCHAMDASYSIHSEYRPGWMSSGDTFHRYVNQLCSQETAIGQLASDFYGICGNERREDNRTADGWGGYVEFYAVACQNGLLPDHFINMDISRFATDIQPKHQKADEQTAPKIDREFASK